MTRLSRTIVLGVVMLGCRTQAPGIDVEQLKGAWTDNGPSFAFVIQDSTILFEFDMQEHPYWLEDSVVVIDFEDPDLGVQRKRVLRLSADELEWQDQAAPRSAVYRRVGQ